MFSKPTRYLFFIFTLFLNACGFPSHETGLNASILPVECTVQTSGQLALTLEGQIPSNTKIQWSATTGDVVWTGQGLTAMFLAPNTPGESLISVQFVSGTPTPYTASRLCNVVDQSGLPSAPPPNGLSPFPIVISELMGDPCGNLQSKKFNQYVELYNFGDQSVDVNGWWLFDEGKQGTPDRLVSWDSRSSVKLDPQLVTNSTVIPPRGFAVILSPVYTQSDAEQRMPYNFPPGTVILSVGASPTLGDDYFGIISSEDGYDTLTLYIGSENVIDQVVDTYGTPLITTAYPFNIDDNHTDNVPLHLSECQSAERVDPLQPDSESNWVIVNGGSPGDGPYP